MSSICAEQHKFHSAHQLFNKKTLFRDVDIPPRKLLNRRPNPPSTLEIPEMFTDSPKISMTDETLLQKFLPYNTGSNDDDDDSNPYSSDHFRMFEFKVRRCTRSRSHDWTDCPFAHPGEKARRRDPRRYHYSGTVCSEYRRGGCSRGDNCEFAHGVFECWLHPARYRTEACKDGKHCKRKVCFFAHTPRQLRVLPQNTSPEVSPVSNADNQYRNIFSNTSPAAGHCCTCIYCTHCTHNSVASSPTSTLMGISHFSPPGSPPLSPVKAHSSVFSPISRFSDRVSYADSCGLNRMMSYKDVLTELMTSLEAMNVNEASPAYTNSAGDLPWADVSFNGTTPNPSLPSGDIFSGDCSSNSSKNLNGDDSKLNDPDLGWVNELLMN